ncbi:hypothetical protein TNCV_4628691 [Trichonephila clavipes]|nr:hypothetical protein TNCV_4628691 [Trichonephila clavipes]
MLGQSRPRATMAREDRHLSTIEKSRKNVTASWLTLTLGILVTDFVILSIDQVMKTTFRSVPFLQTTSLRSGMSLRPTDLTLLT